MDEDILAERRQHVSPPPERLVVLRRDRGRIVESIAILAAFALIAWAILHPSP